MKLTVTDKALFDGVRKAFEERQSFTLSGAGVTAEYVAEELTFNPFGRSWSGKPGAHLELSLTQVSTVAAPATWNGEGLPPVGLECEQRIDFKKAPAYTIINLTELGVDVQKHLPRFQKVKILYASEKYVVSEANGVECMAPSSCVEFRPVRTAEQVAAEQRENGVQQMVDAISWGAHVPETRRKIAYDLYDAGARMPGEGQKA